MRGCGLLDSLHGTARGPILQQFLTEGPDLVAGMGFGFVGRNTVGDVLVEDVEDGLEALAQVRPGGQPLLQRKGAGLFPNSSCPR